MPDMDADDATQRDIVVIGASAGGIEALSSFVARMPRDLPATIFVVLHTSAENPSQLPRILSRAGRLPATMAEDQAPFESAHIYVARPDLHLLVTHDSMRVVQGPRENRHRPAIDPLFRSAALTFGPRVIGIILSGALNDGTAGLLAIKRAGGVAMVQDPATAPFPGMPESALAYVDVDWSVPVAALADKTVSLVVREQPQKGGFTSTLGSDEKAQREQMQIETEIAGLNPEAVLQTHEYGTLSAFTCPDCSGPLWEIQDGRLLRFRCRVGHAFTAETMFAGQESNVETALWTALNVLEESRLLYTRLAQQSRARQHTWMAEQFERKAAVIQERVHVIGNLLIPAADANSAEADDEPAAREATGTGDAD